MSRFAGGAVAIHNTNKRAMRVAPVPLAEGHTFAAATRHAELYSVLIYVRIANVLPGEHTRHGWRTSGLERGYAAL